MILTTQIFLIIRNVIHYASSSIAKLKSLRSVREQLQKIRHKIDHCILAPLRKFYVERKYPTAQDFSTFSRIMNDCQTQCLYVLDQLLDNNVYLILPQGWGSSFDLDVNDVDSERVREYGLYDIGTLPESYFEFSANPNATSEQHIFRGRDIWMTCEASSVTIKFRRAFFSGIRARTHYPSFLFDSCNTRLRSGSR
jgi:hypothetical protein